MRLRGHPCGLTPRVSHITPHEHATIWVKCKDKLVELLWRVILSAAWEAAASKGGKTRLPTSTCSPANTARASNKLLSQTRQLSAFLFRSLFLFLFRDAPSTYVCVIYMQIIFFLPWINFVLSFLISSGNYQPNILLCSAFCRVSKSHYLQSCIRCLTRLHSLLKQKTSASYLLGGAMTQFQGPRV